MMYFIGIVGTFVLANFIVNNTSAICFYIIYLFSRIQMLVNNYTAGQTKKNFIKNDASEVDMLDCLVGNHLIKCNTSENVIEKINGSQIAVLISGKNMVCFYPPISEYCADYEESNIRFISVKIEIASVEFDIKMCGPSHSFYVVGNDLNVDWVRYYFLKFNNIVLFEDVEYILTIIDDDVNFVEINQNECLSLEKNEYNVYTYTYDEEEEELDNGDEEEDNGDEEEEEDDEYDEEEERLKQEMEELDYMLKLEERMKQEMEAMEAIKKECYEEIVDDDCDINSIIAEYENIEE